MISDLRNRFILNNKPPALTGGLLFNYKTPSFVGRFIVWIVRLSSLLSALPLQLMFCFQR